MEAFDPRKRMMENGESYWDCVIKRVLVISRLHTDI